ncbi:hypothetical protein PAPYR_13290 [Paratrimastix pyriformis]|uniref:PH domain-containing protein n=1 Tax=Paratrimastix pyriformis TaxID=342808 RepID=A0ABQ8U5D3_9EUKA|nr:hypothetical protein PAPYR_13290 [Paratrimastix pyriformis]
MHRWMARVAVARVGTDLPYGVELWGPGGSLVFGLDQKQDQELWMEKIREAAHGRLKALRDAVPSKPVH